MSGDRRSDRTSRDRIGALAKGLRDWRDSVDAWRKDVDDWRLTVDELVARRTRQVLIALVVFLLVFVAVGGGFRDLYHRDSTRVQEATRIIHQEAGIIRQFQQSREQNARAACADENTTRANLRQLGHDLGGRRLQAAIARRFPKIDCRAYIKQTLTTGRDPQPTLTPTPTPTP